MVKVNKVKKFVNSNKVNRVLPKASIFILLAACLICSGGLVGYMIAPKPAPEILTSSIEPKEVPVSQVKFDDSKDIGIQLQLGANGAITTSGAGRVTLYNCTIGSKLKSGVSFISINGEALVNLATSVPLWRDLEESDQGKDAEALNTELTRLGYLWDYGDVITGSTINAFNALLAANEGAVDEKLIKLSSILWLPADNQAIISCGSQIGSEVSSATPLAELSVPVLSAKLANLPKDALKGKRVLSINGKEFPIEENGDIKNADALIALGQAASGEALTGGSGSLQAQWVLKTSLNALAIPPSAIFSDEAAENSCIEQNGQIIKIRVISSQLGQSYIMPADSEVSITSVNMTPTADVVCK